jgi:hypothetical protein
MHRENALSPTRHWIARTTQCAQAWRQPRWRAQMLPSRRSWLHASLPGVVAASVAAVRLPSGHGA